jgi:protein TonB
VRPYRADETAPPSAVTVLPQLVASDFPRSEYPSEAKRAGREGIVRLRLVVDEAGRVAEARVVEDPGYGFGDAAVRIAKRWLRFRPGRAGGEPVATEIAFSLRFELE